MMETINNNPYRVIGVLANATAREIQARRGKIQAFSRIGKKIESEYDFDFLDDMHRDENSISKAFSDIEQNQDKVKHALFWFVNHTSFDQMALEHLKKGDEQKAREIWHKVINNNSVTAKNFSAYNNLSTLLLLDGEEEILGIQQKLELIESEFFTDFVHLIADETYSVNSQRQIEIFINEIINDENFITEIPELLGNLTGYAKTYLTQKATEEPIHEIEKAVGKAEKEQKANPKKSYTTAGNLVKETKIPLETLKSVLGVNDLKYQTQADNIANRLLNLSTTYWNNSDEEDSDVEKSIQITKYAGRIAVGKIVKDRVEKDLKDLSEMKERYLTKAIMILQHIKNNYEENEAEISKSVSEMNVPFGQRINWSAVNKMIENSLDWDKVTEVITEAISQEDVNRIKKSTNTAKVEEYKRLVNFLFERKLSYSQRNKLAYLNYWKTKSNQPRADYASSSTSSTTRTSTSSYSSSSNNNDEDNKGYVYTIIIVIIVILGVIYGIWGWEGLKTLGIIIGVLIVLTITGANKK